MKPQVVIDTNVWVSAFRSSRGASRRVIDRLLEGAYESHVSTALLYEYEAVFSRECGAMGLTLSEAVELVSLTGAKATLHEIYYLWRWHTGDPDDAHVFEVAVAAACEFLVTFNVRHLREAESFGIRVVRPVEFLRLVGDLPGSRNHNH